MILSYILYFVITIGVLVLVHEFGHFITAKISGMRVDTFSIGFPPRAFGKKIGETDYCISWIPIGGYVKIAGMIDESMDTDFLNKPPDPREFRSKPMYQRMIVVSAGVLMNFFLAFLIFYGINLATGRVLHNTTTIGYVDSGSVAAKYGIMQGDKIVQINGTQIKNWENLETSLYIENAGSDLNLTVDRNGRNVNIKIPRGAINSNLPIGIYPANTVASINMVTPGMPAAKAGLMPGDEIVSIDGTKVLTSQQVVSIVSSRKGNPIDLEILRHGGYLHITAVPNSEGKIGIEIVTKYIGPEERFSYNVISAIPVGLEQTVNATGLLVKSVAQIATGKVSFSKSVGGPIKIAQLATESAEMGAMSFLGFMALLSISLAVLNILPFPGLDGGHLAFLIYEAVFRKEVPAKVKIYAQQVGFALLLLFMAFVIYNDIAHF